MRNLKKFLKLLSENQAAILFAIASVLSIVLIYSFTNYFIISLCGVSLLFNASGFMERITR